VEAEYKGEVVRSRSLQGFRLVETRFRGAARLRRHSHSHPYISFLFQGSYVEQVGAHSSPCAPGCAVFHPSGEVHSDSFGAFGAHVLNLQLDSDWLSEALGSAGLQKDRTALPEMEALSCGFALQSGLEDLDLPEVKDIALELLSLIDSSQGLPYCVPAWMNRAVRLIQDAYSDPRSVTLEKVATACGVHPIHVSRSFRRYTGRTLSQHVRELRIREAIRMLVETESSICDVAHACGFSDHAHLCRSLKSIAGLTPAGVRHRFAPGRTTSEVN